MALIDCPNCGHKVSDRASVCPSCGESLRGVKNNSSSTRYTCLKWSIFTYSAITAVISLIEVIFVNSKVGWIEVCNETLPAVVICGAMAILSIFLDKKWPSILVMSLLLLLGLRNTFIGIEGIKYYDEISKNLNAESSSEFNDKDSFVGTYEVEYSPSKYLYITLEPNGIGTYQDGQFLSNITWTKEENQNYVDITLLSNDKLHHIWLTKEYLYPNKEALLNDDPNIRRIIKKRE